MLRQSAAPPWLQAGVCPAAPVNTLAMLCMIGEDCGGNAEPGIVVAYFCKAGPCGCKYGAVHGCAAIRNMGALKIAWIEVIG
jgi:hypothetical protein